MRVPITILLADDDLDDCQQVREVLTQSRLTNALFVVHDGEALLDYLHRRGAYAGPGVAPRPGVILLDLNMPRLDGREVLEQIKGDAELRYIPVVVLTASHTEEDVFLSYSLGANSVITKPITFDGLLAVMRGLGTYWFEIVDVPQRLGDSR